MRNMRLSVLALLLATPLAGQNATRPAGWHWRYDRPNAVDSTLSFVTMTPGWHVTTGPAVILYNPTQTVTGTWTARMEAWLFPPGEHAEGFGMFVGGHDLEGAGQSYTYFLIRRDGQFLIKQRTGATTRDVAPWTPSAAIVRHPGDTTNVRNTLSVAVARDSVRFSVNGTVVRALPRSAIVTDGQVGLRVNHGLNIHVARLEVAPSPGP